MSNAVIYARYSSSRQRECSIEQQIKICREYADREGMKIVNVYSDSAITGKTDNRPAFQQMISESKNRKWEFVIVYSLDRFSRQQFESAIYQQKLQDNGVKVKSATEPITDDPSGVLIRGVFTAIAAYYSEELSYKIKRGLSFNASKFLAPAAVPYGFDRSPDGHYIINEQEASIVREIYAKIAAGERIVNIYTDLNERGIRTKNGGLWGKSSFNRLLSNKRYIGTYIYKGTETEDAIPAIIDKTLFAEVQNILKNKPQGRYTGRRTENGVYQLTGRLFCTCGRHMAGISGTRRDGNLEYYYACSGKREGTGCQKKNVRRDYIERKAADAMRDVCMDDDCIRWMAEQTIDQQKAQRSESDLEYLRQKLKETIKTKENATKAVLAGIITDEIKKVIMDADADQLSLTAQIAELEREKESELTFDQIVYFLQQYRKIETDNGAIRAGLLDAFVTKIVLSDETMKIYFSIKKEDRQIEIDLDDPEEVGGSYKTTMWRFGEIIRTKRGFCLIMAA